MAHFLCRHTSFQSASCMRMHSPFHFCAAGNSQFSNGYLLLVEGAGSTGCLTEAFVRLENLWISLLKSEKSSRQFSHWRNTPETLTSED